MKMNPLGRHVRVRSRSVGRFVTNLPSSHRIHFLHPFFLSSYLTYPLPLSLTKGQVLSSVHIRIGDISPQFPLTNSMFN